MRDRQQTMAIGVVVVGGVEVWRCGVEIVQEEGEGGVRSSGGGGGGGYGGLEGAEKMKKRG